METVNIIIEMEDGGVMKGELYPEMLQLVWKTFLKLIDQDFFCRVNIPSCYPRIYDSRWRI